MVCFVVTLEADMATKIIIFLLTLEKCHLRFVNIREKKHQFKFEKWEHRLNMNPKNINPENIINIKFYHKTLLQFRTNYS